MIKKTATFLFVFGTFFQLLAQENHSSVAINHEESSEKGFKIAAVIGHTYIKTEGTDSHIFVPSWGLDIDYWFNHR